MDTPRSWRPALVPLAVGLLLGVWAALAPSAHSAGPPANSVFLPLVDVVSAGPSPTPQADPRFGIIVSGDVTSTLQALGVSWWYDYGQQAPGGPGNGVAQIAVNPTGSCCVRVAAATLQAGALAHPGGYWIIGNEVNVGGQDSVSPSQYATELNYYASTIKGADPTAHIVGPNFLNWNATCLSGCEGNPPGGPLGSTWVPQLLSAWASQYGGEIPIDVWSIHLYAIDWSNTPMDNATDINAVKQDLAGFSNYLAGISSEAGKPIWVTEFGIVWASAGYPNVVQGGCARPFDSQGDCFASTGPYDSSGVAAYINQVVGWFATNGPTYRLERWFLYESFGIPEPYATTYEGISLLTDSTSSATLTQFGQAYRQLATSGP
jgi:hypothetical protein